MPAPESEGQVTAYDLFEVDGVGLRYKPSRRAVSADGGDMPTTEKTDIAGNTYLFFGPKAAPRQLRVTAPDGHVIERDAADTLLGLYVSRTPFTLRETFTEPGRVRTHTGCRFLTRPRFPNGSANGAWVSYDLSIWIPQGGTT